MKDNSGLCEFYDGRTDEDRGHKCLKFKRPKYKRKKRNENPT